MQIIIIIIPGGSTSPSKFVELRDAINYGKTLLLLWSLSSQGWLGGFQRTANHLWKVGYRSDVLCSADEGSRNAQKQVLQLWSAPSIKAPAGQYSHGQLWGEAISSRAVQTYKHLTWVGTSADNSCVWSAMVASKWNSWTSDSFENEGFFGITLVEEKGCISSTCVISCSPFFLWKKRAVYFIIKEKKPIQLQELRRCLCKMNRMGADADL